MKNIWKWVLGVVLILVVAVGLFGMGFIHQTRRMGTVNAQSWHGPMLRGEFRGGGSGHGMMQKMHGFDRGPGRGGMFFGKLGSLIPLALGLLLLYGAYRLGERKNAPAALPVTPAPPAAVTASHPCPTCGSAVQDGWNHCPNCGEKQT